MCTEARREFLYCKRLAWLVHRSSEIFRGVEDRLMKRGCFEISEWKIMVR